MAAPAEQTTLDLTGRFTMNKTLSDTLSIEKVLIAQGVGWFTRKAIMLSTITLDVKHYKDDDKIEHIDIAQTMTGGIPGTTELRTLDWTERPHEDHIFGAVRAKSRRLMVADIEDAFLKEGWTDDTVVHGTVHSYVWSDTEKSGRTWIAEQIWGHEIINEERRYVRHLKFIGEEEEIKTKLVYNYTGGSTHV